MELCKFAWKVAGNSGYGSRLIVFDSRPALLSSRVLDAIREGEHTEQLWREGKVRIEDIDDLLVEQRKSAAKELGLPSDEGVVFCSSGVEAINAAVKGLAWGSEGGKIAVVAGDPEGFNEASAWCEQFGFARCTLPLTDGGAVDMEEADRLLTQPLALGAFSTVTPELFVPRDSRMLADLIHARGGAVAMDITMELSVRSAAHAVGLADIVTLDGARLGGPTGSGLMWVKTGTKWAPLISGGASQGGRRGGSIGLGAVFGLSSALRELSLSRSEIMSHFESLHAAALESICNHIPNAILPWAAATMPLGVTFIVPGIEGEAVVELAAFERVFVSTGSACSRKAGKPSAILTGIGFSPEDAASAIHLDFRMEHTADDVRHGFEVMGRAVGKLSRMK